MFNNVEELYRKNFGRNWKKFRDFYNDFNRHQEDDSLESHLREITFIGFQGSLEAITNQHTGAGHYEHSYQRLDHRSGHDAQDVFIGKLGTLRILRPLVRNRPQDLTRLLALKTLPRAFGNLVADLLLSGMSAEKVKKVLYRQFKTNVSRTTIINTLERFREEYVAWREREIKDDYPHLVVDGHWNSVRDGAETKKMPYIAVMGIREDGVKEMLALKLTRSEAFEEVFPLFQNIKARGIVTVKSVTGDLAGFQTAVRATWSDAEFIPCAFHKLHNVAQNTVDKRRTRFIVKDAARILASRSRAHQKKLCEAFIEKWNEREPKATKNFVKNLDAYYRYLEITNNKKLQRMIRTTNHLERFFREIKRKTKQIGYFRSQEKARLWGYLIVKTICQGNNELFVWNAPKLQD